MLSELDVLLDVCRRLDYAGIDYMLTGSMAMNYYAVPRMTRDIDLVIALSQEKVAPLVQSLQPDYMIVEQAVRDAVAAEFMFNAIHEDAVIKVDFVCRKNDEFRRLEFQRRQTVTLAGQELWIVSREDLVLSKLVWARDSGSTTQQGDIRNLLDGTLDQDYLSKWAEHLGVTPLLASLRP
jgi:hypothetical protein